MSTDSALIAQGDRIPKVPTVAGLIREYGHEVVFPDGLDFGIRDDGLWRVVSLDGEAAGFDYVVSSLDDWEDDDVVTFPRNVGNVLMEFGARGDASMKLVAHVQRAICELSGAHGWIEAELIPPPQMIADCKATAENWDDISAKLKADWASRPPLPSLPAPNIAERIRKWLGRGGWYSLLGWAIGAAIVVYFVIAK